MSHEAANKRRSSSYGHRKSRTSTLSRGSSQEKNGKISVYFKCTVCSVSRSLLKSSDALDENVVGKLLSSQMSKRHAHGAELRCLDDRLNFKKGKTISKAPFRNWVLFSDIEHYFVFPQHPKMFMLAIRSDMPGKSHFETYKCKSDEETNRLCELVCRACQDPMKRLCIENTGIRPYSTLSEVSIHENSVSQPNLWHPEAENDKIEVKPVSPTQENWDEQSCPDCPVPPPVIEPAVEKCPEINSPEPVPLIEVTEDLMVNHAPPSEPAHDHVLENGTEEPPRNPVSEDDAELTTYFDYHPIYGAVLNDNGPIYMYMRRFASTNPVLVN